MTKRKREWAAGFVSAALILAMMALPSLAEEGHGQMKHGGHDQDKVTIVRAI